MTITVHHGDCIDVLPTIADDSIDACVTDPPAAINFMQAKWDSDKGGRRQWVAWMTQVMEEVYRVLKPGAHAVVWALPRTSHWTGTALEDAGFEIRDVVTHIFGQGYPKGKNISKDIDRIAPRSDMFMAFAEHFAERRKKCGISTRELAKLFPSRTGGMTGCVWNWENGENVPTQEQWEMLQPLIGLSDKFLPLIKRVETERAIIGRVSGNKIAVAPGQDNDRSDVVLDITAPATDAAKQWHGWNVALKPAAEFWWLVRKPISEKTIAQNVLRHGTGGLNIDACRIPTSDSEMVTDDGRRGNTSCHAGYQRPNASMYNTGKPAVRGGPTQARWPANVTHSGDPAVLAEFAKFGESKSRPSGYNFDASGNDNPVRVANNIKSGVHFDDTGTPARFFASLPTTETDIDAARMYYTSKASTADRMGTTHQTTKPTELIRWLCKLITPPGGTILDCFGGSGTTAVAARKEGFSAILIEKELEYYNFIMKRLAHIRGEDTPLFSSIASTAAQGSLL